MSRIRQKKPYKFSVYILYLVCILYPVCSLHFVLTGLVLLFLFERASSPDRNIGARKNPNETILAAMIDMWTVFWRAHEEKYNDRAIFSFIPTEDERKCAAYQYGHP